MALYKRQFDIITSLNISETQQGLLANGISYIDEIVSSLCPKGGGCGYELYGELYNAKKYSIMLRSPSRPCNNHRLRGVVIEDYDIYMNIDIFYDTDNDRPNIYLSIIGANGIILSGNKIIDIVKRFSHILHASIISLDDESELTTVCKGVNFSLPILYILSGGISWYNSKGFVSKLFNEEYQHNTRLLSLNIVDFLHSQLLYTFDILKNDGEEPDEEDKELLKITFTKNMNDFFIFFEKYTKRYPFLDDTGLILTKDMSVQEIFTRIKFFVFRNLPKKRTGVLTDVCKHLGWLFRSINIKRIDEDADEEEFHELSTEYPTIILYSQSHDYHLDNPSIPHSIKFTLKPQKNIVRRKTTSKKFTSVKKSTRKRITR
jgi:hypothetical protein